MYKRPWFELSGRLHHAQGMMHHASNLAACSIMRVQGLRCGRWRTCHFSESQPSLTFAAICFRSGFAAVSPWKRDIFCCSSLT